MSDKSKKKKKSCVYCGNNPVRHTPAFLSQSITVFMTPITRLTSIFNHRFFRTITKGIFTPYVHFFRWIKILKFSKDKDLAITKRSFVIWEEAEKRGIEMEQMVIFGKPVEQYRAKMENAWHYFESLPLPPKFSVKNYSWIDNKLILKKFFQKKGVPVPFGGRADSFSLARKIFEKAEKPLIVKPEIGSRGRHTTTNIYEVNDLKKAFTVAQMLCYFTVVEEQLKGSVYRGTYVGGEIVGILRGDPPRVTGNGFSSIKKLIKKKNNNREKNVSEVKITEELEEFLRRQAYTLESILEKGKTIDLSEKIGLAYGGDAVEEKEKAHPKVLETLKKAGDLLKVPIVGFDFIIPNLYEDPENQKWGIIEANSLPFINLHHFPNKGEPVNVAGKIWDLWKKT